MKRFQKFIAVIIILIFTTASCVNTLTPQNNAFKTIGEKSFKEVKVLSICDSRVRTDIYEKTKQFSLLIDFLEKKLDLMDREGSAYILDDLAEIYARGLIDFKKAEAYNRDAINVLKEIQNTKLNNLPVSSYFNGRRDLYYYFYPGKKPTQGMFADMEVYSKFPAEFLNAVRQADFDRLKERTEERGEYLATKLGMQIQEVSIASDTSLEIASQVNEILLLQDYFTRMGIYNQYYKNFYLSSMVWLSYQQGRQVNFNTLIDICETGLKNEAMQRMSWDIDSKNLYHYFLGISYLKINETKKGIENIECFFQGLDEVDQLEIESAINQQNIIDKVVDSKRKEIESTIKIKKTAVMVGKVLAGAALIALLSSGGGVAPPRPDTALRVFGETMIGYEKRYRDLKSSINRINSSAQIQKTNLKRLITPTSLKVQRYLNKFEMIEFYSLLGDAYSAMDNAKNAIKYYEEALVIIEKQRITILSERQRISFDGIQSHIYNNLIILLVEEGLYEEAFEFVERSKSRAFLDILGAKEVTLKSVDETEVYRSLLQTNTETASLLDAGQIGLDQFTAAKESQNKGLRTVRNLKGKELEFTTMAGVHTLSIGEARALTKDNFSIIEYFITDNSIISFLLDNGRLKVNQHPIKKKKLYQLIKTFREVLVQSDDVKEVQKVAYKLYEILFQPIAKELSQNRLYVVPHGWLHYIPFQALHDGNKYLLENYVFTYSPSTTVIALMLAKSATQKDTALIFGNADLGKIKYDLPDAEKEALSISGQFNNKKVLLRKEATETRFKELAGDFNVLHFATHADFDNKIPMSSAIYLSEDKNNDGQLMVHELYQLDLNASLVVLSACNTGLSYVSDGDDMIGLARGMMYAGAKSIVATLWSVEDESTSYIMKAFYKNLQTNSVDMALNKAQIETIKKYPAPSKWASFILTGNYNPSVLSQAALLQLFVLLEGDDPNQRIIAINTLGELNDPRGTRVLFKMLTDKDISTKEKATIKKSLIKSKDSKTLSKELDTTDNLDRKNAIFLLGEMGDQRARNILVGLIDDENPGIRSDAKKAIKKIDTKENLQQTSKSVKAGDIWRELVTGMEFVWVPQGCFPMGSNSGYSDEKPVHEVCVDGFWMAKYEVTQGQYKKIMGSNPSYFKSGDDYPVENISWNDAKGFISRLNQQSDNKYSLPTEAQWEYAARSGGKDQKYSGGSDIDRFAWYGSNSGGKTHRVGTKAPNGLGIYDMSGNVWEWCEDIYDKNAYLKHSRNNPLITSGGSIRVYRGGSWLNESRNVRCADRDWYRPSRTLNSLGFRLIRKN